MAMVLYGATIFFASGAEAFLCQSSTVDLKVTSTADVNNLYRALDCAGAGSFSIMWHASLMIDRTIEVSGTKDVTITGAGFPSIRGVLFKGDNAGAMVDYRRGPGIFSVTNGSTLHLNNLALEGAVAQHGGAVGVYYSSSVFVFGCTFGSNRASMGGEAACLWYETARREPTGRRHQLHSSPSCPPNISQLENIGGIPAICLWSITGRP